MRVESCGYSAEALDVLRRVVSHVKADDPMHRVTILVPSNLAGVVARRSLAGGLEAERPGIAALEVSTLDRLAERWAAPRMARRRPLVSSVLAGAWRTALRDEPGLFADVADHPATIQALVGAYRVLRHLPAGTLEKLASTGGLTQEVVRLQRVVAGHLSDGWYDEVDLLDVATGTAPSLDLGAVVLYLPQDLTPARRAFVDALAAQADFTVVTGRTGHPRADRAIPWAEAKAREIEAPATATTIINASDADDEVRVVVRQVVERLKTTPAHRVAVLYPTQKPYAQLLHEHLRVAGLTVNGPGPWSVRDRALSRVALGLLGLAEGDVPRAELFNALAGTPIQTFEGERIPLSRWERTSRSAGVVRGDDWSLRLERLIEIETAEIASQESCADLDEARIEYSRCAIASAAGLAAFAAELRERLARATRMTSWAELADWATELFGELLVGFTDAERLPAEEQYAAAVLRSTLTALAGLDAVDPNSSLAAFQDALNAAMSAALPRVGRFGEGIYVGPLATAVGLDLDTVFVVGLSEDLCPGRLHEDALLPDHVRELTGGELPTSRDRIDQLHRQLLAAFASAPEVVASFPRGDLRRSAVRLPSRFLLPTLRRLANDAALPATEWERADYGEAMVTSGSFAGELLTTAALGNEQEWRTRQAASDAGLDDAVVEAARTLLAARASDAFTRFDGNLSGAEGLPNYALGELAVSPTALESYAGCPHAFFVRRLLRVEPVEQPEDIIIISPAQVGTFMHGVIDRLLREGGIELPGHGEPWTPPHYARLVELANSAAVDLEGQGLTGHPRLWQGERQRILADLGAMLKADAAWRSEQKARIRASEVAFGFEGQPAARVVVPGGVVTMRGKADLVDDCPDGSLVVIDIKTGGPSRFLEISKDPFVGGTKLQLPVYALAARARFGDATTPVSAHYWFVRKDRGRRIAVNLSRETEQRYGEVVGTLVAGVAAGLFPPRAPEQPDFAWVQCPYCNPDGMGYGELREHWQRKRGAPELRSLLALIEPQSVQATS